MTGLLPKKKQKRDNTNKPNRSCKRVPCYWSHKAAVELKQKSCQSINCSFNPSSQTNLRYRLCVCEEVKRGFLKERKHQAFCGFQQEQAKWPNCTLIGLENLWKPGFLMVLDGAGDGVEYQCNRTPDPTEWRCRSLDTIIHLILSAYKPLSYHGHCACIEASQCLLSSPWSVEYPKLRRWFIKK